MMRTMKTVLFLLAGLACTVLMMCFTSHICRLTWMDWYQEVIADPTWNAWSLFLPYLLVPAVTSFLQSVKSDGFLDSLLRLVTLPLLSIVMTVVVTLVFAGGGNLILWVMESVQDGTIEDKMAIFFGVIGGIVGILLTPARKVIAVIFFLKD